MTSAESTSPSATTGILLLAAGRSGRMGQPKQLMDWNGRPLLRHAAEQAIASGCSPVLAVLGYESVRIRECLAGLPVEIVENPSWEDGMGTTIRTGIQALDSRGCPSVILTLADQPLVSSATYSRIVETHRRTGRPIVASGYAGTVGVPVLFARDLYPALLQLEPTQGCKGMILTHREDAEILPCPEAECDVDTPADYERIRSGVIPPSSR
ncbi:MAG: nucleotidyltransferase family protein [Verrucomicrobiales bacterium]|nr:nucleotidyltransferase family protein [Verrucomicrobiales bacterium]